MRKLKTLPILLLAAVSIAVGAYLPRIVAAVQDMAAGTNAGFSSIRSVALELSKGRESLPLLDKLSLLGEGYFYGVADDKADMTQDEVLEAVETGLAPYYDAELVPYNWTDTEIGAEPYFVYSYSDQETYCIIWLVSIVWDREAAQAYSVDLYVDDDTGKILYIQYTSAEALDVYDLQTYVDVFTGAYFGSLGMPDILDDPNVYDVEYVLAEDLGQNPGSDPAMRYTLIRRESGSLTLELHVYEQGFYLHVD